jgi:AcrR family transcriptional regulator
MAKKSNLSSSHIMEQYIDFVLTHGVKPQSIYHFAKSLGINEGEFYQFFSSFEQIESQFLNDMHLHAIELMEKAPDFENYLPEQKLSTYYFTFLEIGKANRSFILYLLDKKGMDFGKMEKLKSLRNHFITFVEPILTAPYQTEIEKAQEAQLKIIHNGAWLQMMSILSFWIQDTSANFEKTDAFVEKSIKASFDLVYHSPLGSLLDLGKFVWKEGMKAK